MKSNQQITLFEHQCLIINQDYGKVKFEQHHLDALQVLYGKGKTPYFKLINKGVQFCEYVGVLQVGKLLIEVLPKADKKEIHTNEEKRWRDILIDMLKAVGTFDLKAPSSSALKIRCNSVLELYFNIFIGEIEYLIHTGLVKQYRKVESNNTALKGALQLSKHVQKNIIHKERFYTRYSTYDREHIWHIILYKAIKLIRNLTNNAHIHNRIGALELMFPEMPDLPITEATFQKLNYSRKTEAYRQAIEIARLLLLQYHPDVKSGHNHVLALMFDMNVLWEKFVYVSLRKKLNAGYQISMQKSKAFWEQDISKKTSTLRPDIIVSTKDKKWVWDTKWKCIENDIPSSADLMQVFAYCELFHAEKGALVYPDSKGKKSDGTFQCNTNKHCSVIKVSPRVESSNDKSNKDVISAWQASIFTCFTHWIGVQQVN
jgi:5-methylcytosine-specific restriction enzyme subunit McrC